MTKFLKWIIMGLSALFIASILSIILPENVKSQGGRILAYIFVRKPTIFSTTRVGVGTTPSQIYTFNAADRRLVIQVTGTNAMRVAEDSASAQVDFAFILPAGDAVKDGKGGLWQDGVYNDSILSGSNFWGYMAVADSAVVTVWR